MILLYESIFGGLLVLGLIAFSFFKIHRLVNAVLVHIIGLVLASIAYQVSASCSQGDYENIFSPMLINISASLITYYVTARITSKLLPEESPLITFVKKYKIAFRLGLITTMLCLGLVAIFSATTLLEAKKETIAKIQQKSLFTHYFLKLPSTNSDNESIAITKTSNIFINGIRETVAETTGSKTLAENIKSLNFIRSLEKIEYEELLERNTHLKDLVNDPIIADITNDKELMKSFSPENLSLTEVYSLGANEKIKSLLQNEDFFARIRKTNLPELEKDVLKARHNKE